MTDNLDKLLFDIGEEANARVDFDGMQAVLLAEQAKQRAAKTRRTRYMGMAAACVIVLGAAAMMPNGLNMKKAEAEAAPAPMEYAVVTEEAPAAEAPAAEESRMADGAILENAVANACDSCAEEQVEEAVAEEAPAEETIAEEEVEEAAPVAGAGGDACLVNADTGVFEIGIPKEGFEEYLKDNYYGIIVIPFEKSGIPEGHADISVTLCENTAVWNTGNGVYYVEIKAISSAEEFAQILRTACQ